MSWLIEDISDALKSWGHAGGREGGLIMKSDGEPSILALKPPHPQHLGVLVQTASKCSVLP